MLLKWFLRSSFKREGVEEESFKSLFYGFLVSFLCVGGMLVVGEKREWGFCERALRTFRVLLRVFLVCCPFWGFL